MIDAVAWWSMLMVLMAWLIGLAYAVVKVRRET